jgi:hypothetical protein
MLFIFFSLQVLIKKEKKKKKKNPPENKVLIYMYFVKLRN